MINEMTNVRKALWKAYRLAEKTGYLDSCKMSEAYCELIYPTYFDCEDIDCFLEPVGIMIYSYALGPSRRHYIYKGKKEKQISINEWVSSNIFTKAVEVINTWIKDIEDEL